MIIRVASLTLRFYVSDGWTLQRVKNLLVCPNFKIKRREGNKELGISDYFACYTNSSRKVFKYSKIKKHAFEPGNWCELDWYINKEK